jgi:hypothetical protein
MLHICIQPNYFKQLLINGKKATIKVRTLFHRTNKIPTKQHTFS